MFWVIPAGLIASGLAVFKFGYLSKVQVALGLQTAEETGTLQELTRRLQAKGEGIYTIIRFDITLILLISLTYTFNFLLLSKISYAHISPFSDNIVLY
jgi:hypothetical protein